MGRRKGTSSYAFIIPILIGILLFAYVWFVPPEYRENKLQIYPVVGNEKEIPVNQWIGEKENVETRFSFQPMLTVKYIVREDVLDEGILELKSDLLKTAKVDFSIGNNEYIYLEPKRIDGILVLEINGERYKVETPIKLDGPMRITLYNNLKFLQFGGTSTVYYKKVKKTVEDEYAIVNYTLSLETGGRGSFEVICEGNCLMDIYLNDELVYSGNVTKDNIFDADFLPGENKMTFVAREGTDCVIKEINILITEPTQRDEYIVKIPYYYTDINVLFLIDKVEGDPDITVDFMGEEITSFKISPTEKSIYISHDLLSKSNTIRIKVKDGRIYLKSIKVVPVGE